MSSAKKDKGRDPAALTNDTPTTRLVRKFLEMKETDYARGVVIPLLEAEGFHRIDFHHGPTEVGKDLIFYRDKGFGDRSLVVAVVKTDRMSKSASDSSGFPVVLIQATQALSNEVLGWDGQRRHPDELLVILADDPSHDILSSSPDMFRTLLSRGVTFIPGSKVAERLLKLRHDVAENLLQSKLDATDFLRAHPTNLPLLSALNSNEAVDVETIFSELDAAVGKTSVSDVLLFEAPSHKLRVSIREESWPVASGAVRRLEEQVGQVLDEPIPEHEKAYAKLNAQANSKSNKELRQRFLAGVTELSKWAGVASQEFRSRAIALGESLVKPENKAHRVQRVIGDAIDLGTDLAELGSSLERAGTGLKTSMQPSEDLATLRVQLSEFRDALKESAANIEELASEQVRERPEHNSFADLGELQRTIECELGNCSHHALQAEKLMEVSQKCVLVKAHEIDFDGKKLTERIRARNEALVARFQSSDVSSNRLHSRQLLQDTRRYLAAVDDLRRVPELSNLLVPAQAIEGTNRLGGCVLGLLNSGVDILLTGAAGSGKSTTLDMFARKRHSGRERDEEVIFVPLAWLLKPARSSHDDDSVDWFCGEVARVFRAIQPGATNKSVKERIDAAKRLLLVLDGIDEADGLTSDLVKVIGKLREQKGEMLQVVASSRFDVEAFGEIGLFNLVLLPFRPDQVIRFVRDFLRDDPELANEVVAHLERNPGMLSAAQTPLMSTILCVLARNGVALPETKSALYKERFELLWGAYDAKKQVRRVRSSRSCLEDVSKKVAYFLHDHRIRSAPRARITEYVVSALARKYRSDVVKSAIGELVQPCNVLLPEPDGSLGFGHLSYQEYLAAEELYCSRQSELVEHLTDPWWRGSLVLAAMKADDLATIIEARFMQSGNIGDAKATLAAMIDVCEGSQQSKLRRLLSDHERMDYLVDDLDDSDNGDYMTIDSSNRRLV